MEKLSLFGKIILVWFVVGFLFGFVRFFLLNKTVNSFRKSTEENKEKLIKSYTVIIKLYKFFFWLSPVYLFLVPFLIYKYNRPDFLYMTVMMILLHVVILQDFLIRRLIIRKINETE